VVSFVGDERESWWLEEVRGERERAGGPTASSGRGALTGEEREAICFRTVRDHCCAGVRRACCLAALRCGWSGQSARRSLEMTAVAVLDCAETVCETGLLDQRSISAHHTVLEYTRRRVVLRSRACNAGVGTDVRHMWV
jgi:hypothetical protein